MEKDEGEDKGTCKNMDHVIYRTLSMPRVGDAERGPTRRRRQRCRFFLCWVRAAYVKFSCKKSGGCVKTSQAWRFVLMSFRVKMVREGTDVDGIPTLETRREVKIQCFLSFLYRWSDNKSFLLIRLSFQKCVGLEFWLKKPVTGRHYRKDTLRPWTFKGCKPHKWLLSGQHANGLLWWGFWTEGKNSLSCLNFTQNASWRFLI